MPKMLTLIKTPSIATKIVIFSYFSTKTYDVGNSLEVPCWGTTNEYPQHNVFVEK